MGVCFRFVCGCLFDFKVFGLGLLCGIEFGIVGVVSWFGCLCFVVDVGVAVNVTLCFLFILDLPVC